ncbi:MAG TPA: peptide chain release factor N(5)-glutamine methyltransferase [Verrucomicrobiota bacterium]|nr:peptide chain release factor N(5)-glutamine methyltransferase [Verrucomicrobiota bacterium]
MVILTIVTVIEVIKKSAEFLAKKGVESPRLDSELIVANVLGIQRLQLYLNFDKIIPSEKAEVIKEMLIKRGKRIPLQHILGSVGFYAVNIKIDRRALIPRPETELLVENAVLLLKGIESPSVLDFGTGSGCIGIAIAKHIPTAKITAIDISKDALELARENARINNVDDRTEFVQGDGFSVFSLKEEVVLNELKPNPAPLFDAIVSNPPYIPTEEIARLQPEVRDYDPLIALDGGKDGLDVIRILAKESGSFLKQNGFLAIEIGAGQIDNVFKIMEQNHWKIESVIKDYNKIDRIVIARKS